MKLLAILLGLIVFLPVAVGVPDSVITGPYKVSFDLGIEKNTYVMDVPGPEKKEALSGAISTDYSVHIQNKAARLQSIELTIMRAETATPILKKELLEPALKLLMTGVVKDMPVLNKQVAVRPIDGTLGGIASYDVPLQPGDYRLPAYYIIYQPLFDQGYTTAYITASYPWENGTLQFLKTLNIDSKSAY